jgi:hypothetical protein
MRWYVLEHVSGDDALTRCHVPDLYPAIRFSSTEASRLMLAPKSGGPLQEARRGRWADLRSPTAQFGGMQAAFNMTPANGLSSFVDT